MSSSNGSLGWSQGLDDNLWAEDNKLEQSDPSSSSSESGRRRNDYERSTSEYPRSNSNESIVNASSQWANRLERQAWSGSSTSSEEDTDEKLPSAISGGRRKKNDHPNLSLFAQSRESYRQERSEIHEALEHLMVVGNAWRHHDWRLSRWRHVSRPEQIQLRRWNVKQRKLDHPRDYREYSHVKFEPVSSTSHESKERLQAWDDRWDEASFGDGIRLEQFYDRSLQNTADPSRVLLLRSWERAMSIASNTIAAVVAESFKEPSMDVKQNDTAPLCTSTNQSLAASLRVPAPRLLTRSMGMEQCQLLDLDLDDDPNSRTCRTCAVSFESRRRVLDHYYGDDKVRGCCWILIRQKQQQLFRRAVQDQVEYQASRLLLSLSGQLGQHQPGIETWDWQDILEVLERPLQGNEDAPGGRLSNQVIDAATRRLVERYANVPR